MLTFTSFIKDLQFYCYISCATLIYLHLFSGQLHMSWSLFLVSAFHMVQMPVISNHFAGDKLMHWPCCLELKNPRFSSSPIGTAGGWLTHISKFHICSPTPFAIFCAASKIMVHRGVHFIITTACFKFNQIFSLSLQVVCGSKRFCVSRQLSSNAHI